MSKNCLAHFNIDTLTKRWQQLQDTPNIFSYRLNITKSKYLPGKHRFFAEFNPERIALRRAPQTIESLNPPFDEEKFNFNKINPQECIMTIPFEENSSTTISMIINKSPLTRYHCLICPDVHLGLAQKITLQSLRFCVELLLSVGEHKPDFRIGYNSPGALASVNHLHLHLFYIDKDLYIDEVKLAPLAPSEDIYRLDESMPTEAICFIITPEDSTAIREDKLQRLYQFIKWLCDINVPHNLFMTPQRLEANNDKGSIQIFVFARRKYCYIKDLNTYNIGCCELAGLVTLGSNDIYDTLTEQDVINKINSETGQVFSKIYNYFK